MTLLIEKKIMEDIEYDLVFIVIIIMAYRLAYDFIFYCKKVFLNSNESISISKGYLVVF